MRRLCLAVAFLAMCACQSEGPGSASGSSLADAFCKAARHCCASAGSPAEPLVDCEAEFDRQLEFPAFVAKGTVKLDEPAYRDCVALFGEIERTCQSSLASCQRFLQGTLADGASCEKVVECAKTNERPTVCLRTGVTPDAGSTPGVCREIPVRKLGDACSYSCAKGKSCSSTYSTFEVDPPLGVCREDDGLYCGAARVCAAMLLDGAPCNGSGCSSASYCDTVCMPRKANGQVCSKGSECVAGFTCVNGACASIPFASDKTCSGDYN